jgi:hypothetical protein
MVETAGLVESLSSIGRKHEELLMKIEFLKVSPVADNYHPYPTSSIMPGWYKEMEKHIGGKAFYEPKGQGTSHTIKACVPVNDTLTAGYIIPLQADLFVTQVPDRNGGTEPYFSWASGLGVSAQTLIQADGHPAGKGITYYPKVMNPWGIKTPKGYSCLFVSPLNNPNGFFTALPGIVDTDVFNAAVNFPFTMDDPKFTGIIPAGTPVVQVIPFRRDGWESEIKDGSPEDLLQIATNIGAHIFNGYKKVFWSKKEFK